MTKFFIAMLLVLLVSSYSFAGSIQIISLLDRTGENEPSLLIAATDEQISKYLPDGKLHSQILAFYVKFGNNAALFDTGLHDGHVASELSKNGIKPEDMKVILITHLHPDHFGGLIDDEGKAEFPNAEVYISKPECDYWVNEVQNEAVIETLKQYDKHIHLFNFGDVVIEGVRAIETSGHTPGHVSYLVEHENEKLLVVGDIMHFPEIQMPVPDVAVRYDVDPAKAIQSRKFILDYASWKNIPIAGMHITPPGIMNVKKSGEGYEKF